ncbi:GNAT family N-acetyltransferase [Streptococcus parauberis]|uniref:GNAT family N-acetyltransferase n=1 Tax=Streptococcus parauberis TaxID=1348 RepID=UPI000CCF606D|nr:GNAT family N-acetyltransferase [Streptococcus parauberis]PNY18902.1 putative acetyltransferase [Streptococcus parauberis]
MIRLAEKSDIPGILVLLKDICLIHHQVRPDIFKEGSGKFNRKSLEELLDQPDKPIYVYADKNGQILGHLFLEFKIPDSPVRLPYKSLYVEDLCVSEASRAQGVGKALMSFAENLARENGCYNLTLNVWNANKSAYDFYLGLDFIPQQTQMERIL